MTKILTITDATDFLKENDGYLIITHKRPDGDALGSAGALCAGLRRIGKSAYLYKNPEITEKYLSFTEKFFAPEDFSPKTVVAVDTADTTMFPKGFEGKADLVIDHHPSNSGYGAATLLSAESAACGEIIFEVLKELTGSVSREEADLLYIAVSTDTGCFQYANTTDVTHSVTAELIKCGADLPGLNKLFFRTFSKARLTLEGLVFSTLRSYAENKVNIVVITREMMEKAQVTEDDMDDLASLAGKVQGNVVAITIKENDEGYSKVSVRSNATVDASAMCALFGGGGHKMAAGCEVKKSPDETAEIFRDLAVKAVL